MTVLLLRGSQIISLHVRFITPPSRKSQPSPRFAAPSA
jgi:hypothetical protein